MEAQTISHQNDTGNADHPTESVLSKNELFEILKNQRRRDVLRFLSANEGKANLSDLAEHIAAKENGIDVGALSSSQRKRVYIGLYQCHLPKMAEFGVIEYNQSRGTITLLPAAALFDSYLEDADEVPDRADDSLRVGIAAIVTAFVAAGLGGLPVLSAVPAAGWAILSTVALLLFTVVDALER